MKNRKEKIPAEQVVKELADDELDQVTGGTVDSLLQQFHEQMQQSSVQQTLEQMIQSTQDVKLNISRNFDK